MSNGFHTFASDGNYVASNGGLVVEFPQGSPFQPGDFFHHVLTSHLDVQERADIKSAKFYATSNQLEFNTTSGFNTILSAPAPAANQTVILPDSTATTTSIQLGTIQSVAVSATTALTEAQSGSLIKITQNGVLQTITLPALKAGLRYRFQLVAAGAANAVIDCGAGNFKGLSISPTAGPLSGGTRQINFIGGTSVSGDWAEIYCDGIQWSGLGVSRINGGVTIT